MTTNLIGITGYAQSGKDTAGDYFQKEWGFERFGFADAVRDAIYAMNPVIGLSNSARVRDAVDLDGWDVAKTEIPEVRRLLQKMGTEVGRMLFGENVWIDIVSKKMGQTARPVVITDVRFANEADFIHDYGGVVVQIVRPGVGPTNNHASEVIDFDVDYMIQNDGSVEDLYTQLDALLRYIA